MANYYKIEGFFIPDSTVFKLEKKTWTMLINNGRSSKEKSVTKEMANWINKESKKIEIKDFKPRE